MTVGAFAGQGWLSFDAQIAEALAGTDHLLSLAEAERGISAAAAQRRVMEMGALGRAWESRLRPILAAHPDPALEALLEQVLDAIAPSLTPDDDAAEAPTLLLTLGRQLQQVKQRLEALEDSALPQRLGPPAKDADDEDELIP